MNIRIKGSTQNDVATIVTKAFLAEKKISYVRTYRNRLVEGSDHVSNISNRSLKFYGCSMSEKNLKKLNKRLKAVGVKAKLTSQNVRWAMTSLRITNI